MSAARNSTSAQPAYAYLEPAALKELRNLRFAAKRIVEGTFAGRHRSRLKGSSVEFADYREYTPGDDLRRLDWKVYHRTKRAYIRTYDEETSLSCTLALDVSASMNCCGGSARKPGGARAETLTKLDYARFLAAALSYLIVQNRDEAGLALLGGELGGYLPPRSTHTHLDELLNRLERAQVSPQTRLSDSLRTLFTLSRRRGVLLVISDFLDDKLDEFFQTLRLFHHRRFEIVLLHILHPEERTLPEGRAIRFFDPEGGAEAEADPQDVEFAYGAALQAHLQRVRNLAVGSGCEYQLIDTSSSYPDALRAYLRTREDAR